ncbi:4-amino-4-deoxychorismate lyase (aminotransferase), component of p-aminobenzoate synthase multienzyme complex [Xenorhabdus nematophila str. Anatoliense]|nr:4-amino-4-deoxychorismate lyase (aminotransferase), component of p-aminobenzoate synthase multienzyme complex [Xenorhabdus nematophila str. Anatoliense]CEE91822.1 4-amino-4-deoxychorismate lyase (aminotransferase), component of p-aminobenzoate synthase multienzyme complex [Xenorhabdus nematophila str. Anatoliense]
MTYWINGNQSDHLPVNDRAVQFGDGCFTTIRIEQGQPALLSLHIRRLQKSVEKLLMPASDWTQLENHIKQVVQECESGVLKVILSRGAGNRGYSIDGAIESTEILSLNPYPEHYIVQRQKGVSLALSPISMGINPYLAGIKHLNRLEQVLIKHFIDKSKADEALVLDSDGLLVECCSANIFWRKGKNVYTPDLSQCGVDGVMRQKIIELLAESDYNLSCVMRYPEVLAHADEVIICNSLMPVMPVTEIQAHKNQPSWKYQSRELHEYLLPECLRR